MCNDSRFDACLQSTSEEIIYQKRARGEKHTAFYSMSDLHLSNTLCSYLVQAFSVPAGGKLCFCFVLFGVFLNFYFLATSKLVDTVLGNECVLLLCVGRGSRKLSLPLGKQTA